MGKNQKKRSRPVATIGEYEHPYRNISNLYAYRQTLECSTRNLCIPCSYKIACFDIALDSSFTQKVPNIRPEMCPRASNTNIDKVKQSYGYKVGMNILTVGDGDFSFSLALARMLHKDKNQQGRIIATSYESKETLLKVYPNIQSTMSELDELNVQVCYNVDATNLTESLPKDLEISANSFDRVVWNFPCSNEPKGQDGQNQEMDKNKRLVQMFVKQCELYLKKNCGEIHFMHKTKPPYDQWTLEEMALQNPDEDKDPKNHKSPFEFKGRIVFDRCLLKPYVPRKALDKKSFPCHDACMFVFGWESSESENSNCDISNPTIPVEDNDEANDDETRAQVVPVTKDLIDEIRSLHMSLGSYKERKKRKR
ncbi:hypothetical protein CTEN210_01484 [Chaetoceros tenuissimus]|uniref:25S rRNA (uridine-N(3))-methyltransferase BMT5-like domain-containing protein n=1 Tax=Chaetoceros tenuissimus TaxID=426638 RepID=A0AAD3CH27_9STRA|nr:hypothetical protein CTEN210_01484 [Chaetoceros tenuissimus]